MSVKEIKLMKAMEILRAYARDNVPANITYYSLNESKGISEGLKTETNIVLQQGLRRDQSDKSNILVAFLRVDSGERRQFYLPLLFSLNGVKIKV